jgi:hypothetical protein
MDPITFYASIQKVQTMVDGGLRVWLDLPEDAIMQVAELMVCKRHGVVLNFVATEYEETGQNADDGQPEHRKIHI